jgi:hypothetical protein
MYTSVIFSTGTFDFSKADLIATAPSLVADTDTKEPLNWEEVSRLSHKQVNDVVLFTFAVGVRAALKI